MEQDFRIDIDFEKPKVQVSGRVKGWNSEMKGTQIKMTSSKGEEKVEVNDGEFSFDRVLVGEYKLEIMNEKFCWDDKDRTL